MGPAPEWVHLHLYLLASKTHTHTHWYHSAVPALFIGNVEFFSATTLNQGIFSALINTADKQDVHGCRDDGREFFFDWIWRCCLQTLWGGGWVGGWLYMYVCEAGSDIKSINRYRRRKCIYLGVSLGSSLQEKAESITQCVLSRQCGLKKP